MKSIKTRVEDLEARSPSELYVKIFKDEDEKIVTARSFYYDYLPLGWSWGESVQRGSRSSDIAYLLDGMEIQSYMCKGVSYEDAIEIVKNGAMGSSVETAEARKMERKMQRNATKCNK